MTFSPGDRVKTPKGFGMVLWQRMKPPSYSEPATLSVCLDSEKERPEYSGTVFPVEQVESAFEQHDWSGSVSGLVGGASCVKCGAWISGFKDPNKYLEGCLLKKL